MAKISISEIYKECEKVIDRMRLDIHIHADEAAAIDEFVQEMNRPKEEYRETHTTIGYHPGQVYGILVQFHMSKFETFNVVIPLIEFMLSRGWVKAGMDENAAWGYRGYQFKKPASHPLYWDGEWKDRDIKATIRAWVHPLGQTCKKVEDGVEPIYKFVCE
jgi:hypothetical protein